MTAYEKEVIKAFLNEAFGQMSAEVDGQTIIPGYFDMDSSYHRSGAYISERYYRKNMDEVKNYYNAREISRDLAYMRIDSMIRRIADLSTGGNRTFTRDETWLVDRTVNELMDMFTGYTIAAE